MKDFFDLLARMMLSSIFLFESYDSIFFFEQTKETMTSYGIDWRQDLLLYTMIIILIVGSILVLIGYHSNFGAILLLSYFLPYTLIVFSFWNDPPDVQHIQALNFMKNIGVCGGLLLLVVHNSGKYSIKRLIHVMRLPS
jgi:putative oxidoreductase